MLWGRLFLLAQWQSRMEVTLLLPQDLCIRFSLYQARRYPRLLSESLVSLIYQIVTKPCPMILTTKTNFLLNFSLNFRIEVYSLLLSRECFSILSYLSYLSLSPNYLISCFLQQVCVGPNPHSWSRIEALHMGTLPHLLINSWGWPSKYQSDW
jgi:hypothetical protein